MPSSVSPKLRCIICQKNNKIGTLCPGREIILNTVIEQLKALEAQLAGSGDEKKDEASFFFREGRIPILVSAPHAVDHFRNGKRKWADLYTGGIALYLHEVTGCHVICSACADTSDPNYDPYEQNPYQQALTEYVEAHGIRFVIDLHGASAEREYALEIGTAPEKDETGQVLGEPDPSLHEYRFVPGLIEGIFEPLFAKAEAPYRGVVKNRIFDAGSQNTVTKSITGRTGAAGVQLEINRAYRDPEQEGNLLLLLEGFEALIAQLSKSCKSLKTVGAAICPLRPFPFVRALSRETGCETVRVSSGRKSSGKKTSEKKRAGKKPAVLVLLNTGDCKGRKAVLSLSGPSESSAFLEKLTTGLWEYTFEDYTSACVLVRPFAPDPGLSGKLPSEATGPDTAVLQLTLDPMILGKTEPEKAYRDRTVTALRRLLHTLSGMDWLSEKCKVYRIFQAAAGSQIPQDKIEVPAEDTSFSPNAFLHLLSYNGSHETVRCYPVSKASGKELEDFLTERKIPLPASDFVMLTNRMIELLYGREWYEHTEETPGLFGAPIVVYEPRQESYDIGIPKADQVHRVLLSTSLYREKLPLSRHYEYLIFNPYADSRMYLNLENADYGDNGRVKDKRGNRGAQKVMLPRYYRLMMGYLEKPLKSIRAEEYRRICDRITDPALQKDFDTCYEKVSGQAYYMLRDTFESEERRQIFESSCERVIRHLTEIGVYSGIHLIRIPKKERKKKTLCERIRAFRTGLREAVYRKAIGQAEYILKTCWAGDTDDKNNVARLNSNMMSLIGVSENDKIRIRFGPREITLRILSREDLTDYEIGIPASGRRALAMNSMNDIVSVSRDMEHTFKRHSQEQTIAILGTVLAAVQVLTAFDFFTATVWGVLTAVLIILLAIVSMLYFALSEERVKIK